MREVRFTLPDALLAQGFVLRQETEADTPFLMRLYASTRARELSLAPWSDAQKQAFIASQFQAQRHHYRTALAACDFLIIENNGAPIGRLYLENRSTRIHVVDITLVPASRGRGLGGAILSALQRHAADCGLGVGLMVDKLNPALRLYRRSGWTPLADHGVYLEMEWTPDAPPASGACLQLNKA